MSVYNVSGASLASVYGVGGTSLPSAYDVDGEAVFSPNPLSIKVMTYNCGQWLTGQGTGTSTEDTSAENHRALLQSIITAQDPDILCIQEYWDVIGSVTVTSLLGQYFPYIQEVNGETTYFGHAVCSKYPITNFVTSALSNSPSFEPVGQSTNTGRFIDRCNITIDGRTLTVFNTHFDLSTSARANNTDWLLPLMRAQQNVIACGDYNTACNTVNDPDYGGVIYKFLYNGYHCANCSSFGFINTWTDSSSDLTTGETCDNIVTSANISIDDVYIDSTKLTDGLSEKIDHVPLIAELTVY